MFKLIRDDWVNAYGRTTVDTHNAMKWTDSKYRNRLPVFFDME